ncbi:PIPO, partial [Sweet potato virus C]|uniref:PIPO n=1 Tax=Sweet potato virus C TaxID=930881 RepID=UPI000265501A
NLGHSFKAGVRRTCLVGKMLINHAIIQVYALYTRYVSATKYRRFQRQSRRILYCITHKECSIEQRL